MTQLIKKYTNSRDLVKRMQVPMYTVLTREAVGSVRDIHDRMPVILDKNSLQGWIRPDGEPSAIVEKARINIVFEKAEEYPKHKLDFMSLQNM